MKRIESVLSYSTLTLNGLLIILAIFSSKISPANWLQAGGRLHPLLLHLPIGFYVLFMLLVIGWSDVKSFRKTSKFLIHLTAFLIVLTALAGILLSREGGYDEAILKRHLVLGTIMSGVTLLLSQFSKYLQHRYYKIYASLGMAILLVTGHFGAVLTHGENYIFEPVSPKKELPKDSTIFSMAVQPVLNAKCGSCHNPSKKKGELVLTLHDGILKGGEHGAVFEAGNPGKSKLISRPLLPLDDDDHMPPAGKAQLTDNEISLLRLWISAGAKFDTRYNASHADSLQILSDKIVATYAEQSKERQYPFAFVDSETIAQLNTPFRTVKQISTTEPAVKADFFLAQYFQPQSLDELKQVAENVIDLNLAGMPIGDEVINAILKLYNLERLNLNNTKITDRSLEQIAKLEKLAVIRVAGTATTGKGMELLTKSKSIKEVYGWNTKTNDNEWIDLRKRFTGISWNTGFKPEVNEVLKLTPPILRNESFLLSHDETIVMKHNLPGTLIRYTLDGTTPDSAASAVYEKPLKLASHSILKAIAVKDGWLKSNEVQYQFFVKGIKPESSKLLTTPNKNYKANGSDTFTNSVLGDPDNFRDGNWLGYREEGTMSSVFSFSDQLPKAITIVYLQSMGSYIVPPETIEVLGSDSENTVTLLKQVTPIQPKEYLPNGLGSVMISLEKPSKWIKLNIKPVAKLPQWHSGKGEKGWVMVSEIIFH
jgi:uncharacterized membrane protein